MQILQSMVSGFTHALLPLRGCGESHGLRPLPPAPLYDVIHGLHPAARWAVGRPCWSPRRDGQNSQRVSTSGSASCCFGSLASGCQLSQYSSVPEAENGRHLEECWGLQHSICGHLEKPRETPPNQRTDP